MATAADVLRAIEVRADRALVTELRLMVQEVLAMRPHATLEERAHADALLLKLGHLERAQQSTLAADETAPAFLMPALNLPAPAPAAQAVQAEPDAYRVELYAADYGDLQDVLTVASFSDGVALVRQHLARDDDYVVTASWVRHHGELTVTTPRGLVLARVQAASGCLVAATPAVLRACDALRAGNTTPMAQLFGRVLAVA
jgi:hypothetical protein